MKRISYGFLIMVMVSVLVAGCATKAVYMPVDLNPQIKSGQFVQKTDNFIVLLDKSASMTNQYGSSTRLEIAKDVTARMVATIPDIKLNAGLRTFQDTESTLIYGMTPFNFLKALDAWGLGYGMTPMEVAFLEAGNDLEGLAGNSAIIVVSDFEDIDGVDDINHDELMKNIGTIKAKYGDRVCIYTIQVDVAPKGTLLAEEIVRAGKCGFAVNANDLATPATMAVFVEKVFLGPPPPPPPEAQAQPKEEVAAKAEEAKSEAPPVAAVPAPVPAPTAVVAALDDIHFDYDKATLRLKDREILKRHAKWLMKNRDYSIVVEGHCDERGTNEYNLALGERRTVETKKYLVALGIEENRIKTISYGEEKPRDPGHNEEAWAKNRRAQFVLTANK